jgi:hypothetical protein
VVVFSPDDEIGRYMVGAVRAVLVLFVYIPEVSVVVNFWGYVFERVESPGLWWCIARRHELLDL